jgi:hypothetical protein
MIIGSLNLIPFASADESPPEKVPEPWVHESHKYNLWGDINGVTTHDLFINEGWSISVAHGDVMTLISARNISQPLQNNISGVDYQNNIHYRINGTLYLAQFSINELAFNVANQTVDKTIRTPLSTCSGFELEYSPIRYNGTVPTFDCNITFEDVRVYQSDHPDSTFDLTLIHHIRADWNQTDDKIEAQLDFGNTRFYQSNGTEFDAGVPFTAELEYSMSLRIPGVPEPINPTSCSNTTLNYNMTLDNGSPLTISKLNMKDSFMIYNGTGTRTSVGYSKMMAWGGIASVTHGFPNMTYQDTQSMKSDPEISVVHDRVTEGGNQEGPQPPWELIVAVGAIGAVAAVSAVVFMRKRKKKGEAKGENKPKKL